MNLKMAWKDGELPIPLPDDCRVRYLTPEYPMPLSRDVLRKKVKADLETLRSEIRIAPKIILIVEDGSRITATGFLTEQLVNEICAIRGSGGGLEMVLAAGAHGDNSEEDLVRKMGHPGIRATIHRATDYNGLGMAGESRSGIPLWFNRRVIEADLRLTVSTVNIHPMAGFSGGGKILLPGVAGLETIEAFHRLPSGIPGNYQSQMRELINEVTAMLPILCSWHLISRPSGEIVAVFGGPLEKGHAQGISELKKWVTVTAPEEPVDLVLAGCRPFNRNLLGTFKAMAQLDRLLKPDGRLVMFNEAANGRGAHYWRNQPQVIQTQKDHAAHLFPNRHVAIYTPNTKPEDFADLFPRHFRQLISQVELDSFIKPGGCRTDTIKTAAVIPFAPVTLIIPS